MVVILLWVVDLIPMGWVDLVLGWCRLYANFARGTSTHKEGISVNNSSLISDAGSISLYGLGYDGLIISYIDGIDIRNASIIQSTTGDINVYGIGGKVIFLIWVLT